MKLGAHRVLSLGAFAASCLASSLQGQSINVDFGVGAGAPGSGFGGAAEQAGYWNRLNAIGGQRALAGLDRSRTGATIRVMGRVEMDGGPVSAGPFQALMNDKLMLESGRGRTGTASVDVEGLAAGRYRVYTFACGGGDSTDLTVINVERSSSPPQVVAGACTGIFLPGLTHAVHEVDVEDGGTIVVTAEALGERGSLNGIQIVQLGQLANEYRSIDGSGNNLDYPDWGSADSMLLRMMDSAYDDGLSAPSGVDRPGPRCISNGIFEQLDLMPNSVDASDMLWQWGQFIDHDITLVLEADPIEQFFIPVPEGDPFFDPKGSGDRWIPLNRSTFEPKVVPRQQVNILTAYIDASMVYGSDEIRAETLRTNDGTGRLRTSAGNLLPFNTTGLFNFPDDSPRFFLAGDVRCNEQVGLTSMHTVWVREHNRLAAIIAMANPQFGGEEIYQRARSIVGAEIQVITFEEFLPTLLGPNAIAPYEGYDPTVNAGIANVFATGCYRLGHSLLSPVLQRIDADGDPIRDGGLGLHEAFFVPERVIEEGGIEPIIRGQSQQVCQELDSKVVDAVRNFLFGAPTAGGFDLVSLNLQRGRDHGLASYNEVRQAFGLAPAQSFSDISSDPVVQQHLQEVYSDVAFVDVWAGGLSEDHFEGAMVGELFSTVLKDQFERLRDGDRFWYQNVFSGAELETIELTRLSDVIRRNTSIGGELQDDVFHVATLPDGDDDSDDDSSDGGGDDEGSDDEGSSDEEGSSDGDEGSRGNG
jgi:hypothetical protein